MTNQHYGFVECLEDLGKCIGDSQRTLMVNQNSLTLDATAIYVH